VAYEKRPKNRLATMNVHQATRVSMVHFLHLVF